MDSGEVRVTPSRPRLRIREDVREQHCRTLRQALHVWLDQFPNDFDDPPNYPCLTQLEAFCRRVLPNSELDIKVHRKASQIRRPQESPPQKLGYPPGSKPPRLVLKSASLIHGGSAGLNNNNSVLHAKEPYHHGHPQIPRHDPPVVHSPFEDGTASHQYLDFLDIPEVVFARQLTRMDCVSWDIKKKRNSKWLPIKKTTTNKKLMFSPSISRIYLNESYPTNVWVQCGPAGTSQETAMRPQW